MGIFFVYILKSSFCLTLFYLFYRLLLSKETFHRFNRLALLGVLALSSLVPLIGVATHEVPEVGQPFFLLEEMAFMKEFTPVLEEVEAPFPWRALLLLIYLLGVLFFMLRHLWSLSRMIRLLRASRRERLEGGVTLFVHHVKEVAPFSWMKSMAVSEADLQENGDAILMHERAHVQNGHSWDLLLAEACVFSQWFNPAAWLLKQELQTIHEYEADEWVIRNGIDARTYQLLIIKKAVGARLYSIANSFNHSSLKKRITMMIKKKSNPWARLKYLYVLPLAAVAVAAFARPEVSSQLDEISVVKVNDLTSFVKEFSEEKADSSSKSTWHEVVVNNPDASKRLEIRGEVGKKPLYVIDDMPFPSLTLDDIDATMVESVTILKAEEAVKEYGEKAKDGAIIIVSKQPEKTEVHRDVKFNVSFASKEKFDFSGQVLDEQTKKPVPGASVVIRGTNSGAMSDAEGKFRIQVKNGDVVQVSYVGMQTQSIVVDGKDNCVVWMKEDVQMMDEMTIVGYASDGVGAPSVNPDKKVVAVVDIPKVEEEVIFQVVEEMPQFPEGMNACMAFLGKNIRYPISAQKAGVEGRVVVQFVVNRDGSLSDIRVVSGVCPDLDAEALRVVSMMPKWNPGKQRGKAVSVKYNLSIMFSLQNSAKDKDAGGMSPVRVKVDKDASCLQVDAVKDMLKKTEVPGLYVYGNKNDSVLVIVDGKMLGHGMDCLKKISVDQIQSVSVMKNPQAIAEYGDKAKGGVISVVLKKN